VGKPDKGLPWYFGGFGRARWTLDLLAGAMVRLTEHDSISRDTVRRRLAENEIKPWRKGIRHALCRAPALAMLGRGRRGSFCVRGGGEASS
jgi:hypothetical protein